MLTKVRLIDTFLPVARGGTYCIPGPFGAGKTVLQQITSRNAEVDIVIIAACGERAGEVVETLREFPELTDPRTGRSLMERTVIICNTSSMPVAAREASVYTAVTIAEYYRQMGLNVLMLADSTSRWAQAMREMSGRLEEIPGEEAFPGVSRIGNRGVLRTRRLVRLKSGETGSVTIGGTVSPAGGNFEEPVTQATLKVVGAFHGLSRARSDARKYPAIDPMDSWSKYPGLVDYQLTEYVRNVLFQGDEVGQMMKVVGEEGTALEDYILNLKSDFLDAVYLQQNAFDPVDAAVGVERQRHVFDLLFHIVGSKLKLDSKEGARTSFTDSGRSLLTTTVPSGNRTISPRWKTRFGRCSKRSPRDWNPMPKRRTASEETMRKVYSRIESIVGNVITVKADGVRYGELATVSTRYGESLAEVIRMRGDSVSLQVYAGGRGISTGDELRFMGHPMQVSFSDDLMGRIFDGSGQPRDNGPQLTDNLIEIGGPSVNPSKRIIPRNMIRTGIPMIDLFNTLVESQKLPIFSVSGEPYNQLLARIAMQAEVDIIILGGIGLKHDDYLYFKDTLENGGALSRTIMFVHTASDPVVEALLVPDISLAVAEKFALGGKRVLVLLTDMTNFADAMKEIAITQEQVPSNRGYPGDLYSQLASRYEKAVDFEGAGSITTLGVTTMPGDDVTHPVPDNTGYITEGQYYLRNGRIEPFGSLSRLKQQVNDKTRDDHRAVMDGMIKLYANYKESQEKKSMGFRMSEWDDKLLKYGEMFERLMMDLSVNIPLEEALDRGWRIMADCFEPQETGLKTELINEFWPDSTGEEASA